ncbi:MAG: hypothetical protein L6R40_000695 [Gallowayella cf. fulva]|nr:MAG: hypothetical protein L6R40_000695 [Xanthomendoza cf. fulva]
MRLSLCPQDEGLEAGHVAGVLTEVREGNDLVLLAKDHLARPLQAEGQPTNQTRTSDKVGGLVVNASGSEALALAKLSLLPSRSNLIPTNRPTSCQHLDRGISQTAKPVETRGFRYNFSWTEIELWDAASKVSTATSRDHV